jgi:hypothetical protein
VGVGGAFYFYKALLEQRLCSFGYFLNWVCFAFFVIFDLFTSAGRGGLKLLRSLRQAQDKLTLNGDWIRSLRRDSGLSQRNGRR